MTGFSSSLPTRAQSAIAATISPTKPTTFSARGFLLAVVTSKNNATHSCGTAGWAQIGSNVNSGASFTASLWKAEETAAAPTFTWTGAAACSAMVAYYNDPQNVVDSVVGAVTSNFGNTATHTTSAITTARNGSLVVYVDVAAANTAIDTPSGWSERIDTGSATDNGRTTFGDKDVPTSGSSSGAISVTGANADWVQWQVEIMGQAPANGFETSKAEVGAWYEPPTGFSISKIEVGAWYEPPTGFSISKIEVGSWLDAVPKRRRLLVIN